MYRKKKEWDLNKGVMQNVSTYRHRKWCKVISEKQLAFYRSWTDSSYSHRRYRYAAVR